MCSSPVNSWPTNGPYLLFIDRLSILASEDDVNMYTVSVCVALHTDSN